MSEAQAAVAATAAAPAAPAETEVATGKEAIYVKIGAMVQEMTQKRIGKTGGRKIFDAVVEQIFAEATKVGETPFRFNGGFGSLHLKKYGAGSRRLPSGAQTTFGERTKLRYEEGVVVEALVKNGGDLTEALTHRGSRAKEDAPAAAKANGAAAPAGAAEKPEGEVELS